MGTITYCMTYQLPRNRSPHNRRFVDSKLRILECDEYDARGDEG